MPALNYWQGRDSFARRTARTRLVEQLRREETNLRRNCLADHSGN